MLEKIIIGLIIIIAVGLIVGRIRSTMKGDTCAGCSKDCNSCNTDFYTIVNEDDK